MVLSLNGQRDVSLNEDRIGSSYSQGKEFISSKAMILAVMNAVLAIACREG